MANVQLRNNLGETIYPVVDESNLFHRDQNLYPNGTNIAIGSKMYPFYNTVSQFEYSNVNTSFISHTLLGDSHKHDSIESVIANNVLAIIPNDLIDYTLSDSYTMTANILPDILCRITSKFPNKLGIGFIGRSMIINFSTCHVIGYIDSTNSHNQYYLPFYSRFELRPNGFNADSWRTTYKFGTTYIGNNMIQFTVLNGKDELIHQVDVSSS